MPSTDAAALFKKHARHGVLVDTNILLVYLVGLFDPNRVSRFNRTNTFTTRDFLILQEIIAGFNQLITTPSILTEVSNLIEPLYREAPLSKRIRLQEILRNQIKTMNENYVPSADLCTNDNFVRFGLTDIGIAHIAREKYLVLSVDLPLCQWLAKLGIDCINYNHIRPLD